MPFILIRWHLWNRTMSARSAHSRLSVFSDQPVWFQWTLFNDTISPSRRTKRDSWSHRSLPHFHPKMHLDVVNSVSLKKTIEKSHTKTWMKFNFTFLQSKWSTLSVVVMCDDAIVSELDNLWHFLAKCGHFRCVLRVWFNFMMIRANISISDDGLKSKNKNSAILAKEARRKRGMAEDGGWEVWRCQISFVTFVVAFNARCGILNCLVFVR